MQAELINIIKNYQKKLLELNPDLISYLIAGDLHHFENQLFQSCTDLYNQIAFVILSAIAQSEELKQKAQVMGQNKGLKELRKLAVKLQLKTGAMITIFSWYASPAKPKHKSKKRGPNGTGCHLLLEYWGCILKATPGYYSYISTTLVNKKNLDIDRENSYVMA